MEKKTIETIVDLLTDLPDNKATSIMNYVKSLKDDNESEPNDGVREAYDWNQPNIVGEAGP